MPDEQAKTEQTETKIPEQCKGCFNLWKCEAMHCLKEKECHHRAVPYYVDAAGEIRY